MFQPMCGQVLWPLLQCRFFTNLTALFKSKMAAIWTCTPWTMFTYIASKTNVTCFINLFILNSVTFIWIFLKLNSICQCKPTDLTITNSQRSVRFFYIIISSTINCQHLTVLHMHRLLFVTKKYFATKNKKNSWTLWKSVIKACICAK